MRVAIIGAGPAGLYCAYLFARTGLARQIRIFEQNSGAATFGFGVVFSNQALGFLHADDRETFDKIVPELESWENITVVHQGQEIAIDGVGFAAISRLSLLHILQERVDSVGIKPSFGTRIKNLDGLDEFDLVVGADGVNSVVRSNMKDGFGAKITERSNVFAWFGTAKRFDTLTQTFVQTEFGPLTAHHYRYEPEMSTFIVEMTRDTWRRTGLDVADERAGMAFAEAAFADTLGGAKLISNKSVWRRFPDIQNRNWHTGRFVLLGDALKTAHYSIGSGTRLAMQDAKALVDAFTSHGGTFQGALEVYETNRRPMVDKLVEAANASAKWYEAMDRHMHMSPYEFAWSYIMRSGRMDTEKLAKISPAFCSAHALDTTPREEKT